MDGKCPAYNGDQTYAFISYAHKDNKRVLPVIEELFGQKYRIWYDEGIEAGAEWPENIADRLVGASLVILFISGAFLASPHCRRELTYAVSEQRRMLCVMLERVKLPKGIAMQLSTVEKLNGTALTARELAAALVRAADGTVFEPLEPLEEPEDVEPLEAQPEAEEQRERLDRRFVGDGVEGYTKKRRRKKNPVNLWRVTSIVLVLALLGGGVFALGYIRGWFGVGVHSGQEVFSTVDGIEEQLTVTTWSDPLTRDLMLRSASDTAVYLCGNAVVDLASAIRYDGSGWYAGSQRVENGGLTDLSTLSGKHITHLAAVDQQLTGVGDAAEFEDLVYLDVSGNDIADLSPLNRLQKLETVKLLHISATDLSVLKTLPALRYVYISRDMAPYADGILDGGFEVILKR